MWVICTGFEWIACKKWAIHSKNVYSLYVFDSFPPFLCPRVNRSCPSSLIFSFLKSDLSDSLLSLFTKEWPWVIRSDCSWKKRDNERFTQVAHVKRATGANRSFAHKKRVNRLKTDERIPNLDLFTYPLKFDSRIPGFVQRVASYNT